MPPCGRAGRGNGGDHVLRAPGQVEADEAFQRLRAKYQRAEILATREIVLHATFPVLVDTGGNAIHHSPLISRKLRPSSSAAKFLTRIGHNASNATMRPFRTPFARA